MADTAVDFKEVKDVFIAGLSRGMNRKASLQTALASANLIRKIVVQEKYDNVDELLAILRDSEQYLSTSLPTELIIRNVFLIAMKLSREENSRAIHGVDKELGNPYDSLNTLWKPEDEAHGDVSAGKKIRKGLIAAVKEVITEMESSRESIICRVFDVVSLNDTVLAYCLDESPTLLAFLSHARGSIKMRQVFFASRNEDADCIDFASPVPLCEVASKMSDITKILLPCAAVFPDGACLCPAGSLSIAHSAARHAVPVHVVAAFYKIAPYFVADSQQAVLAQRSAGLPVSFSHSYLKNRVILSPLFDVIPANLVSLYISNSGAVLSSHIYRLISDYYHPQDITDL